MPGSWYLSHLSALHSYHFISLRYTSLVKLQILKYNKSTTEIRSILQYMTQFFWWTQTIRPICLLALPCDFAFIKRDSSAKTEQMWRVICKKLASWILFNKNNAVWHCTYRFWQSSLAESLPIRAYSEFSLNFIIPFQCMPFFMFPLFTKYYFLHVRCRTKTRASFSNTFYAMQKFYRNYNLVIWSIRFVVAYIRL